jgi:hypothetical protein
MEHLALAIKKLQASHNHLENKEIALAKLLIKQSIEDLKLCMTELESDGAQTIDVISPNSSDDPAGSILAP